MRSPSLLAGLVACGFALAAGPSGAAAESCDAARAANNPAFGTPSACAPKPAAAATSRGTAATPRKPDTVTTRDGRTQYRWDDTTVSVGGYVAADTVVGRGRPRP